MTRSQTIQQQSPIGRLLLMVATLLFNLSISGTGLAKDTGETGGEHFPNTELASQHAEKMKLFDDLIRDQAVAIDFIFARKGGDSGYGNDHNHDNHGHDGRHDERDHQGRHDDRDGRYDDRNLDGRNDDRNGYKGNKDRG